MAEQAIERLDRINLMEYLEANAAPDKVLFLRIIQDAANCYLYTLVSKNLHSIDEFFFAHQYFFRVDSNYKHTWDKSRTIRATYTDNSVKIKHRLELEDGDLKLMCFDRQFDLSGLSDHMHISRFRTHLKDKRRKLLEINWEQVNSYISKIYEKETSQIWKDDIMNLLIDPPTPQHLANLIYVSNKLKRQNKRRHSKSNVGMYAELAYRLENQIKSKLAPDWGPLATLLEGVENAQGTNNDSGDSVLCDTNRRSLAASSGNGG